MKTNKIKKSTIESSDITVELEDGTSLHVAFFEGKIVLTVAGIDVDEGIRASPYLHSMFECQKWPTRRLEVGFTRRTT